MRIKHFRLETEGQRYLIALLPINFGKLADDRAVEAAIATEGFYMLAIDDDDAYVEADPYGWDSKDGDLFCAHLYLRENVKDLRGGQILHASNVRADVAHILRKLKIEREESAPAAPESNAAARERGAACSAEEKP